MKKLTLLAILLLAASLSCKEITGTGDSPKPQTTTEHFIGFDFKGSAASFPGGDEAAPTHLFIHKYPIPGDGYISGLILLNDADILEEGFSLLILRPNQGQWEVIHRVDADEDDQPVATTGISTIDFGESLPVREGDIFAHWQAGDTGPIPMNTEETAFEGFSFGKFGFNSADIEVGQVIPNNGFSGGRDYFVNLIFENTND